MSRLALGQTVDQISIDDQYDLCLSGKTDPWFIRSAWPIDQVFGWEQDCLNDLAHVSWVKKRNEKKRNEAKRGEAKRTNRNGTGWNLLELVETERNGKQGNEKTKHKTQNTKHKTHNTKHKTQNTKHKTQEAHKVHIHRTHDTNQNKKTQKSDTCTCTSGNSKSLSGQKKTSTKTRQKHKTKQKIESECKLNAENKKLHGFTSQLHASMIAGDARYAKTVPILKKKEKRGGEGFAPTTKATFSERETGTGGRYRANTFC